MMRTKRIISLTLVVVMLLQMFNFATFAASPEDFVDFPDNWSTEAMTAAVENGLLEGTSDTTIEPNKKLTRAEFAAIITRAFGATTVTDISAFTDVTDGDWFNDYVAKSVKMQVLNGTGDTTFSPKDNMRREDVFLALARVLFVSDENHAVLDVFTDKNEIDTWAIDGIAGMTAERYVNGYGNGLLMPRGNITRAELAQVFHNLFKMYISEPGDYDSVVEQGSVVIRSRDVVLHDVTVNGDLIIADGVGDGDLTLRNVHVNGRILVRGGEGLVRFENVTAEGNVIINDVNGTVNFHNYRTDKPFHENLVENTPATFLDKKDDDRFGPSMGGGVSKYKYFVEHMFQNIEGTDYVENSYYTKAQFGTKNSTVRATALDPVPHGFKLADDSLNGDIINGIKITANGMTLKVYYDRLSYNVEFVDDEGNLVKNVDVKYEATLDPTDIPEEDDLPDVEGKHFVGWDADGDGEADDLSTTPITGDTTLKPVYETNKYEVVFNDADGNPIKTLTDVEHGYKLTESDIPDNPTAPAGQKFAGWATDPAATAGAMKDELVNTEVVEAVTYYPVFADLAAVRYYIDYYEENIDDNNYSLVDSVYGSETPGLTVTVTPSDKTGFDVNTAESVLSATVPNTADEHILSVYYKREIYNVEFVDDEGNPVKDVDVKYEATLKLTDIPEEDDLPDVKGKHFIGWDADGDGEADDLSTTPITGDTTLKPVYETNTYDVVFVDADDNPVKTLTDVEHGYKLTEADIPDDPAAPAGKKFAGWAEEQDAAVGTFKDRLVGTEITEDKTFYPVFVDDDAVLYYVEHYFEELETDDYVLDSSKTVEAYAIPSTTVTATVLEVEGYEENVSHPDRIASDVIPVDGSRTVTLKLYYNRLRLTLSFYDAAQDGYNDETETFEYPYKTVSVKYGSTASMYSDEIDELPTVEGYFKNQDLIGYNDSDIYSDEDYVHEVAYHWWYLDNEEYVKFTEDYVFTTDLDVYAKVKKLTLSVTVPQIKYPILLTVYYDEDTRLADTVKDGVFYNKKGLVFEVNKAGIEDKLYSKLAQKGLMEEGTYEILNINKFIRFARLMGEANFKEFLKGFYQEGEDDLEQHLYNYIINTDTAESAGRLQTLVLDLYKEHPDLCEDMLSQIAAHLIAKDDEFVKQFFIDYADTHVENNDTEDLENMVSDMLKSFKETDPDLFTSFVVEMVVKAIKNNDATVVAKVKEYIQKEVKKGTFNDEIVQFILEMEETDFRSAAKDIIKEDVSIIESDVEEKLLGDDDFVKAVVEKIFGLDSQTVDNKIKSYIKDYYLDDYIAENPEKIAEYISDDQICDILDVEPGSQSFTLQEKIDAVEEFLETETDAVAKLKGYAGEANINKMIDKYLADNRNDIMAEVQDTVVTDVDMRNDLTEFAIELIKKPENSTLLDFAIDEYLDAIAGDEVERENLAKAEVDRLSKDEVYNLEVVQDAINEVIDSIIGDIAGGSVEYNGDIAKYVKSIDDYTSIVHSFLYTDDDATRNEAISELIDDVYYLEDDHKTLLKGMNTMTHGMLEKNKIELGVLTTIIDYIKDSATNGDGEDDVVGGVVINGHTLVHDIIDKLLQIDDIADFAEEYLGWADPTGRLAASKKFESEVTYEEKFEVNPDNLFIMELVREKVAGMTLDSFMDEYVYSRLPDRVPRSLVDKLPIHIVETIYQRAIDEFIAELDAAVAFAENEGGTSFVHSGVFVRANPFDDVALPLYDYLLDGYDKAAEKAESYGGRVSEIYLKYYRDNPYIDDIVKLSSPELYINGTGNPYYEDFSGYTIASFKEIYEDVLMPAVVLGDDLFLWYIDRVDFSKIRGLVEDNEALVLALANHPNALLARYAEEGLPEDIIEYYDDLLENDEIREAVEKIDNKVSFEMQAFVERVLVHNTVEMYYYKALERFGVKAEEMLNKYADSDVKKEMTPEDLQKLLDEAEVILTDGNKGATTDYYYDKAPGEDDIYDVVFRGYEVTLERKHSDY